MSWWPNYKATFERNWSQLSAATIAGQCPTLQATIKDFNTFVSNPTLLNATSLNQDLENLWDGGWISTITGLPPTGYNVSDQQMYEFLQSDPNEMQAWLQQILEKYCSNAPSPSPAGPAGSNTYWIVGITIVSLLLIGAVLAFILLQK